jgi:hypothetical protein
VRMNRTLEQRAVESSENENALFSATYFLPMYSKFFLKILDARNPLLFRSPDLEKYVKEVSALKANLILLNKVFIILLLTFIGIVATVYYLDLC